MNRGCSLSLIGCIIAGLGAGLAATLFATYTDIPVGVALPISVLLGSFAFGSYYASGIKWL